MCTWGALNRHGLEPENAGGVTLHPAMLRFAENMQHATLRPDRPAGSIEFEPMSSPNRTPSESSHAFGVHSGSQPNTTGASPTRPPVASRAAFFALGAGNGGCVAGLRLRRGRCGACVSGRLLTRRAWATSRPGTICSMALCCGGRARAGWLTMLRFYDRHRSEHNSPWTKNGCRVTA